MPKETRDPGHHWRFLSGFDLGADGDPYMDRFYLIGTPLFGVYLHKFHRPDREPCGHDHPWWFVSMVLSGAYGETVYKDKTSQFATLRWRKRFSIATTPLRAAHRIDHLEGSVWTLVIVGPRLQHWAFFPDGRRVPHEEYLAGETG